MRRYLSKALLTAVAFAFTCTLAQAQPQSEQQIADIKSRIGWIKLHAVRAAIDDMSRTPDYDKPRVDQLYARLEALCKAGFAGLENKDPKAIAAAKEALEVNRAILLSNPLLDVDQFIVGRYEMGPEARKIMSPGLGNPMNNWSNHPSIPQTGYNASIEILSGLRTPNQSLQRLYKPDAPVALPDLTLHWDAKRLMFSMPEPGEHHWQVYEIRTDGTGLQRLTNGTPDDMDFFDATYLPDGNIIAASNVGVQGVPCVNGGDQVGNLCVINPQTNNIRRITFDQDANWGPVVMNNGRVMYVRWEYTDLTHYFSRIVMHMNPDGTEQRSFYGSGSVFPTSIYDVKPLPGHPTRFVGIISGHHGVARSGRLILFDPAKDRKENRGMMQEIPFSQRAIIPIVKDEMVDGVWPQFTKPQPIGDNYFIVTAKLTPDGLWGLYLVDVFDNVTLIREEEGAGYIYGIPLVERETPPTIPSKVDLRQKEATVFIQDLYEGEGLQGVPRGTVKELRVFAYEYAYLQTISDHTAQGIQSGWDIKRLLGTVAVEDDGSVMFKVPANTPISLQPLDAEGRAVQWMRSWLTGQPGEVVSCVGCHEDQNSIPVPKSSIAARKTPKTITTPEGGVCSFTFDYQMQPILDRNCVSCHNGQHSSIDLRGGRKETKGYGTSYLNIHPYIHRQGPEAGMKVLYPYEYHANVSPLVQMLHNGHYGVSLTDGEWRTLYNWIDFNAPDKGRFEAVPLPDVGDQIARRIEFNKRFSNGIYADWQEELKRYGDYLASKPAPQPAPINYTEPRFKEIRSHTFPFELTTKPERRVVNLPNGQPIVFVKIPAGEFIMGKNQANTNYAPAHKATVEKSFWMSEKEITNDQFALFFPHHDSRYVDQMWKDHVTEGYSAHEPQQPVIRVSQQEAMEFCTKLGESLGLNVTLPTETQWEWAARAGSGEDFWYGNINTDFGRYENLSDVQMNKMAVIGVNPQPMSTDNEWYKYYAFHPKMESVDDGHMILTNVGSYLPNPFGLYDMDGNVAEWTRSDYVPYGSKRNTPSPMKVVRGGSWKDHPSKASAVVRRAYYPHQKVHNVGFRMIIEE